MEDKPYAAASVTFVNRDTSEEKITYCYPITRIELLTQNAQHQGTFIANVDGSWVLEGKNAKTKTS